MGGPETFLIHPLPIELSPNPPPQKIELCQYPSQQFKYAGTPPFKFKVSYDNPQLI